MSINLYEVSVATLLQMLGAMFGVLEKGAAHCREHNLSPETLTEARIHPDMQPLRFQVLAAYMYTVMAMEAVQSGEFAPAKGDRPHPDYAGLQAMVEDARAKLRALQPDAINARTGGEVVFRMGPMERTFSTENFVLSMVLPNFFFHATTCYDILRAQGVPLGKMDFLGELRLKSPVGSP